MTNPGGEATNRISQWTKNKKTPSRFFFMTCGSGRTCTPPGVVGPATMRLLDVCVNFTLKNQNKNAAQPFLLSRITAEQILQTREYLKKIVVTHRMTHSGNKTVEVYPNKEKLCHKKYPFGDYFCK
jgi:hypothetical protein